MSYSQLGYSGYPSSATVSATSPLTSSQLLVPGCTSLSSSLPAPSAAAPPGPPTPTSSACDSTARAAAAAAMSDPSGATQSVYSSSLLSYPRLSDTVYGSAYAAQGYVPFGADPSAFYAPLGGDTTEAWRNLSQTTAWPYDPNGMAGYPYSTGYGGLDVRRKNATRESTATLKAWLYEHIKNPYPTKGEKIMLAIITKMTLTQVSTWFANARRRLKKENKMQWSPRNRTGDDDDKINSDDDDDKEDSEDKDGVRKHDDKKDDDEDIVVDGGNDTDSLLSGPQDHLSDKHRDELDNKAAAGNSFDLDPTDSMFRRHTTSVGSSAGSTSSPPLNETSLFSPLSAGAKLPPPGSLTNGIHHGGGHGTTVCSNLTNLGSLNAVGQHNVGQTIGQTDTHTSEKPRIWSIADVATSSSTHVVRRSPLGLSSQLPSKPGHTAFSPPSASPHGFQPWVNGGFSSTHSSVPTSHTGLSYSSYHLGHHPMSGMTQVGGMSAMGGAGGHPRATDLGSNPSVPCVNPLASPPSYTPKLSNGFLGDKPDLTSLSSFTSDDTQTAFKPVVKSFTDNNQTPSSPGVNYR